MHTEEHMARHKKLFCKVQKDGQENISSLSGFQDQFKSYFTSQFEFSSLQTGSCKVILDYVGCLANDSCSLLKMGRLIMSEEAHIHLCGNVNTPQSCC